MLTEYENHDNPDWQAVKDRKYKNLPPGGYKCQDCPERHGLAVHHLSYIRVCEERDEDLIYVCKKHHEERHARLTEQAWREEGKPIESKKPPRKRGGYAVVEMIANVWYYIARY